MTSVVQTRGFSMDNLIHIHKAGYDFQPSHTGYKIENKKSLMYLIWRMSRQELSLNIFRNYKPLLPFRFIIT